jgi:dipeptidyl aminopeptidase/acylaminoacyl peptidase
MLKLRQIAGGKFSMQFRMYCAGVAALLYATLTIASAPQRPLTVDDINAIREVGDPQVSPDGDWVAYTVRTADHVKDRRVTRVWMASWDGERNIQLTYSEESEHTPRWSPDGRYLGFLTARGKEDAPEQVWLLDRLGGEAKPLTGFNGDVLAYEWSPDGKRIALIVADEEPQRAEKDKEDKTTTPIVIDRFYFKEDETGYLGAQRQHLYVFDVATRKAEILTPGNYDEALPAWSPDSSQIAFVSKRSGDPDRNNENGLYVIAARPGSTPRLLTTFHGDAGDGGWMTAPSWRPDGREIAITAASDPNLIYYATQELVIVATDSGAARTLAAGIDRNILSPRWSDDGAWIYASIEDDRNQHFVRLNATNGKVERLHAGRRETTAFDLGPKRRIALLDSTVDRPEEVYALDAREVRPLTHQNDEWLASVQLAAVEEISFPSKDGAQINGFLVKPPGYSREKRYPTLLQIHGGPVSQFANAFMPMWQIFASQGYVVVAANPRGSSGRGEAFAKAIWAEWGGKDTEDVLAAVDYAVRAGVADSDQLGVGGWSYGGILTNVVIAKDARFKAATSGASIGNALAGYGTDMYIREYELELGTPWKNLDVYLRNAYPLLHADRIKTPTLFLCGERDFNVPLFNSEQMYQALRSLDVDTQLIIYPDQFHGLRRPSYLRDRMQRYVDWYAKYLKNDGKPTFVGEQPSAK